MNAHASDPQSTDSDDRRALRWSVYLLLIALAVGQAAGKILAVNSVDLARLESHRIAKTLDQDRQRYAEHGLEGEKLEQRLADREAELEQRLRLQRPFLSANDRSRWMAIRALTEQGDFEIERYFEEPTWDTIDMVQHRGRDGELHLYSSKPPLLMVLLSAPYWAVMQTTGMTLGTHPYEVGRGLLLLCNGGALLVMLLAVAVMIERLGSGDLGRIFAMATCSLATMLTAFTPVLNNHLFAAAATAVACACWTKLIAAAAPRVTTSVWTGAAAAFAAACELPALALVGCLFLSLAAHRSRETLVGFLPAALVVGVAFFATNYWAHNTIYPPYSFRSETDPDSNWYDFEYTVSGKTRDSYWRNPSGVDRGEASQATYALHSLVGHHGVLSLTPVWLLCLAGGGMLLLRPGAGREFAIGTALITIACLVFYLGLRPQADRNYGGMTSGFRWLFWMAPMWGALLPPAVEWCRRSKIGYVVCLVVLGLSATSAAYPTWNPWSHPWVYRWLEHLGFQLL